jgi:hypothetical protein
MKLRFLTILLLCTPVLAQHSDSLPLRDRGGISLGHPIAIASDLRTEAKPTNVVVRFCHAANCAEIRVHNLRTNGGADMQAAQMATTGSQPAPANYIALSNDATAPAATDCAAGASSCTLTSEITTNGVGRAQATYAHTNGTNTVTLTYTFTFTGSQSVQKAGLFNAASNGVMFLEFQFPQRAAQSGDTLQITWTETI